MLLPFNSSGLYPFSSGMSMPMALHFLLFRLFFQERDLHQGFQAPEKSMGQGDILHSNPSNFFRSSPRFPSVPFRERNRCPVTERSRSRHCPCGRNLSWPSPRSLRGPGAGAVPGGGPFSMVIGVRTARRGPCPSRLFPPCPGCFWILPDSGALTAGRSGCGGTTSRNRTPRSLRGDSGERRPSSGRCHCSSRPGRRGFRP